MMRQAARALLRRDLQLLWVRRGDALQPALFALLTVVLFAIGLNVLVVFRLVDGMLELAMRDALTGTSNRLGLRRALDKRNRWRRWRPRCCGWR